MARRLVATVLSLFFVGLAGKASAESESEPSSPPGVISLFGKTLCLPAAPPHATCTWRIPAREPTSERTSPPLFSRLLHEVAGAAADRADAAEPDGAIDIFGVRVALPTSRPSGGAR